ncbi:MAG: universal stress protein [Desulfobacterales bacterium]|nr:universal stress protein [Desulfobacterales bacterium]
MEQIKKKPQKILWATDFSGRSRSVLPFITSQLRDEGADIHLLYVIPDIANKKDPWYGEFTPRHANRIVRQEKAAAQKRLDQLCIKYLGGCARFTKHTAVGDPAREILKLIEKEKMDMVVMARRKPHIPDIREGTLERVKRMARVPVKLIET